MTRRFRAQLAIALVAMVSAVAFTSARQQTLTPPSQTADLTATLPVDPQITVGQLSNGLRY